MDENMDLKMESLALKGHIQQPRLIFFLQVIHILCDKKIYSLTLRRKNNNTPYLDSDILGI